MISLKQLSKQYDKFLAVDRLSLDIPEGQVLGLLGPNGAGKSTTLRILTGYLQPSAGQVLIDGNDIQANPERCKAVIGYLPESSPLYGDMLVYDYLKYIAAARNLSSPHQVSRIEELALLCGIGNVMHKNIAALSKGYRQRVGLALAMMGDPKILVLDEPTSGLDPNQIGEIREIIREIGKKKTVIFSTHILSEAEATCDRLVIINKGRIVADNGITEFLSDREESSLDLQLAGADQQDALSLLKNIPGVLSIESEENREGLKIRLQSSWDIRTAVYNAIRVTDWVILELHQETLSLEDIFKQLTLGGESA